MDGQTTFEVRNDAGSEAETRREPKQWTIKNLDAKVVSKTREAARRRGMKIGAWVETALNSAADDVFTDKDGGGNSLQKDIFRIVEIIEDMNRRERESLSKIEKDINALMKGQHGIMARMLHQE
jgi:hypothetical protein